MNLTRSKAVTFNRTSVFFGAIFQLFISNLFAEEGIKQFEFKEVGIAFSLPTNWFAASADDLKKANDTADSREPNHAYRYIAILNDAPPPSGRYISSDYIIVQRTPGSATPEEIIKMFPTIKRLGEESSKNVKDYIHSVEFDHPYIDSKLNLVVLPHKSKMFDGSILYVRYYLVITRTFVIGINTYAHEDKAEKIFGEVETGLAKLKVQKEFQLDDSWFSKLKELVGE